MLIYCIFTYILPCYLKHKSKFFNYAMLWCLNSQIIDFSFSTFNLFRHQNTIIEHFTRKYFSFSTSKCNVLYTVTLFLCNFNSKNLSVHLFFQCINVKIVHLSVITQTVKIINSLLVLSRTLILCVLNIIVHNIIMWLCYENHNRFCLEVTFSDEEPLKIDYKQYHILNRLNFHFLQPNFHALN